MESASSGGKALVVWEKNRSGVRRRQRRRRLLPVASSCQGFFAKTSNGSVLGANRFGSYDEFAFEFVAACRLGKAKALGVATKTEPPDRYRFLESLSWVGSSCRSPQRNVAPPP